MMLPLAGTQFKTEPTTAQKERWDFDAPIWDQCSFFGRLRYYFWITDPRLTFVGKDCFDQAKHLRDLYLLGKEPKGITPEQLLYAKRLYENGFHPDNEEYMNKVGRMSFYALGSMLTSMPLFLVNGGLRTTMGVVFWQWVNQSFNALVNYTNRNANSPLSEAQLGLAYLSATAAACATAIGFKKYLALRAAPVWQRYVPFAAVAAANCVNIPLMRQNEIVHGVDVFDDDGNKVGKSRVASVKGITQTVISRILMCAPGMLLLPLVMRRIETICWFRKNTWSYAPFQTLAVGAFLTCMVPVACAMFPQRCELRTSTMELFEPSRYREINAFCKGDSPDVVYFNKGL